MSLPWVMTMADQAFEWSGEHFWSLVGKLSIVLGLPLAVPIIGGFFWLGQISARMDGTEHQMGNLLTVVSGLVTLDAGQTVTLQQNEAEITRLRNIVDDLVRQAAAAKFHQ